LAALGAKQVPVQRGRRARRPLSFLRLIFNSAAGGAKQDARREAGHQRSIGMDE